MPERSLHYEATHNPANPLAPITEWGGYVRVSVTTHFPQLQKNGVTGISNIPEGADVYCVKWFNKPYDIDEVLAIPLDHLDLDTLLWKLKVTAYPEGNFKLFYGPNGNLFETPDEYADFLEVTSNLRRIVSGIYGSSLGALIDPGEKRDILVHYAEQSDRTDRSIAKVLALKLAFGVEGARNLQELLQCAEANGLNLDIEALYFGFAEMLSEENINRLLSRGVINPEDTTLLCLTSLDWLKEIATQQNIYSVYPLDIPESPSPDFLPDIMAAQVELIRDLTQKKEGVELDTLVRSTMSMPTNVNRILRKWLVACYANIGLEVNKEMSDEVLLASAQEDIPDAVDMLTEVINNIKLIYENHIRQALTAASYSLKAEREGTDDQYEYPETLAARVNEIRQSGGRGKLFQSQAASEIAKGKY